MEKSTPGADPLADLSVKTGPETNLRLIMKGGVIYKNSLA